jgi:hypothetical protein
MAFASADANGTAEVEGRQSFTDIDGERCEGAVNVLNALGVVNGFPDGTFRPNEDVTRAHMAQMITKALDIETYANATSSIFSDMDSATWAIPQVEYCAQLGIVKGYGDGRFGPNDLVTYEQAATMLTRALGFTDDCNEMIAGVWPANYVQKALDLGIFTDTNNGGQKNANRGDVALMLYNTLNLPQVYIDNDGVTHYRSGSEEFVRGDNNFWGTSMLFTLNKDGSWQYKVVDMDDIDNAIYGIQEYLGAVAKVYENKDGDVLAIGDIQSSFITGTFNGDFDEFTVDGKVYTFSDNAVKEVNYLAPQAAFDKRNGPAPVFVNGSTNDGAYDFTTLGKNNDLNYAAGDLGVKQNQKVTLAVKTSGSTVSQVYSAVLWYIDPNDIGSVAKVVDDSDIDPITSSQKLLGKEFVKDDEGAPDVNTFVLVGVESLNDISEDDVVAVYADNNKKIRKVEVGTETIEGNLDSFSTGSLGSYENDLGYTKDRGKPATAVIDGASYKTSVLTIPYKYFDGMTTDEAQYLSDWLEGTDSDDPEVGDTVKAFLDCNGDIFKVETSEAGSSSYALVLDYDINHYDWYENGNKARWEVANGSGLNGNGSMVELLVANGSVYTFYFKDGAEITTDKDTANSAYGDLYLGYGYNDALADRTDDHKLYVGDIVTYQLNSSNRVRKITIKSPTRIDDRDPVLGDNDDFGTDDVSNKGYWKGNAISTSVTGFSIDKFKTRDDWDMGDGRVVPSLYIDDDNVGIVNYDGLKGTDDVKTYGYVKKNNNIAAMVIDGNAVSGKRTFGFLTGWTKLGSDHSSGCDYQVTVLLDGVSSTYYYDVDDSAYTDPIFKEKQQLLQLKFNANGYINRVYTYADDYEGYDANNDTTGKFEGQLLGYNVSGTTITDENTGVDYNANNVTIKNNGVCVYENKTDVTNHLGKVFTLDSDVVYFEWKGGPGNMATAGKADITGADEGKVILYYDVANEDVDHPDGIIDIVILANTEVLNASGFNIHNL